MKFLLIGAAFVLSQTEVGPGDDGALEVVRAGYMQRLASIGSIKASFETRGVNLETLELSEPSEFVEWVSCGDNRRYRRNPDHLGKSPESMRQPLPKNFRNPVDSAVKDGISTTLRLGVHGTAEHAQATIAHCSPGPTTFTDFRSRCLDFVRDSPPLTVAEVLEDKSSVSSCERTVDGHYVLAYEIEPGYTVRIWFDSKLNFMVDRMEKTYTKNPRFAGYKQEVVDVIEARPGIWFPRAVDLTQFRRNESSGETIEPGFATRTIITELSVNEPLPEDAFEITFPPGTEVSNEVTGKLVFWGVDGPASKEIPLPKLQTLPEMVLTEEESRASGFVWLMVVNLVVVAIVALAFLVRRRM